MVILMNDMWRHALLSPDHKYRYSLIRSWGIKHSGCLRFIMLNPSTADDKIDDPTIRRCIGFAKDLGFDRVDVFNLFNYRSTDPKNLKLTEDPIGPDANRFLEDSQKFYGMTICAWGKHGTYLDRDKEVMKIIGTVHALKVNKDKTPAHPLYLKSDLKPFIYTGRNESRG